jgi:hypothetical protein
MENKQQPTKEFFECYQYFNVYDLTDKIKQLSEVEKYLLLACAIDEHDEDQNMVIHNFTPFEEELDNIKRINSGETVSSPVFDEIEKYTGDRYISTSHIDLPKIFTKQEARQLKINNLLDN